MRTYINIYIDLNFFINTGLFVIWWTWPGQRFINLLYKNYNKRKEMKE